MINREIQKTDLSVSPICLGTMTFGTPVAEDEAIRLTHAAIDMGVNFIDSANIYEGYGRTIGSSGGVAETILGRALKDRRDEVVLATKVGMSVGDGPGDNGTSPAAIRKQLDKSLQRLATDRIDIYYLHRYDADVRPIDILETLARAINTGKVRHYGISNYSTEQLKELLAVADANDLPRPVIGQPYYSLLRRGIENDLLPLCQQEKIAIAPYRVLEGGLLTGKYQHGQPPPAQSRQAQKQQWMPEFDDAIFEKVTQLTSEAQARGRTLVEHALLAILEQKAVVSLVLGVKRIEQLQSLVDIAGS